MDEEVTSAVFERGEYRLMYDVRGEGPPLLLLHGLGGPQTLARLAPVLSRRSRVFVVTLPGFQPGGVVGKVPSCAEAAVLLGEFCESVVRRPVTVVGVSYGGQIAVELAARVPRVVAGIVIAAGTGMEHDARMDHRLVRFAVRSVITHLLPHSTALACLLGRKAFFDARNRPRGLCEAFREMLSMPGNARAWFGALDAALRPVRDWRTRLGALSMPVLLLWGMEDRILPPRLAEEFRKAVPHAHLEMFKRCGHSLPLECPEEMAAALWRFLR